MKVVNYKNGNEIRSLEDWFNECPPKGKDKQWVKGRSAYELAREYLDNGYKSIGPFFSKNKIKINICYPEYNTKIDNYGQGRSHDLLMLGSLGSKDILISVEGKVDESFGNEILAYYYMKARVDELNGVNTNRVKRVDEILVKLFSNKIPKKICRIRFQLLTALYGTLIESERRKIKKAYLIIQVFKKGSYSKDKIRSNYNDLNRFIRCFDPSDNISIEESLLLGPYNFESFKDIDLYIGYKNEI